jgi:hypothetical protein
MFLKKKADVAKGPVKVQQEVAHEIAKTSGYTPDKYLTLIRTMDSFKRKAVKVVGDDNIDVLKKSMLCEHDFFNLQFIVGYVNFKLATTSQHYGECVFPCVNQTLIFYGDIVASHLITTIKKIREHLTEVNHNQYGTPIACSISGNITNTLSEMSQLALVAYKRDFRSQKGAKEALATGKWLRCSDFKFVLESIVKKLDDICIILQDKNTLEISDWAWKYQVLLITGMEMVTGGQRSQFLAGMTTKNVMIEINNDDTITYDIDINEKRARNQASDFILPLNISKYVAFWMQTGMAPFLLLST